MLSTSVISLYQPCPGTALRLRVALYEEGQMAKTEEKVKRCSARYVCHCGSQPSPLYQEWLSEHHFLSFPISLSAQSWNINNSNKNHNHERNTYAQTPSIFSSVLPKWDQSGLFIYFS